MSTVAPERPRNLPAVVEARKAVPVKWWAGLGTAWLLLMVYMWTRWLVSGHAHATPTGPTPVPTWQTLVLRLEEGGFLAASVPVLYFCVWKPWREGRGLTLDGMLLIGLFTCWAIQDPWANYTRPIYAYNADLINLGCPQCWVPGWQTSHAVSEGLLFDPGIYLSAIFLGLVVCNWVMRRVKAWRPQTGTLGLIGVAYAFMLIMDLVTESVFVRGHAYIYPGAPRSTSLFAGTPNAFPIFEIFAWGAAWAAFACLRYFKNDRGETLPERGASLLAGTPRRRRIYCLVAVIGALNLAEVWTYNIPMQWLAMHDSAWPQSVTSRSYLTDRECGLGTNTLCPSERVPAPVGSDSARVGLDGKLFAPKGVPVQPPSQK
jgi:Spirocyclase AveC-like